MHTQCVGLERVKLFCRDWWYLKLEPRFRDDHLSLVGRHEAGKVGGGGGDVCLIGHTLLGVARGKGWWHIKPDVYRRALPSTLAALYYSYAEIDSSRPVGNTAPFVWFRSRISTADLRRRVLSVCFPMYEEGYCLREQARLRRNTYLREDKRELAQEISNMYTTPIPA